MKDLSVLDDVLICVTQQLQSVCYCPHIVGWQILYSFNTLYRIWHDECRSLCELFFYISLCALHVNSMQPFTSVKVTMMDSMQGFIFTEVPKCLKILSQHDMTQSG